MYMKVLAQSIDSSTVCRPNKDDPKTQICKTTTIRKILDPDTRQMVFAPFFLGFEDEPTKSIQKEEREEKEYVVPISKSRGFSGLW